MSTDMSSTIKPKSDQLNADDLLLEGKYIKIRKVDVDASRAQQKAWIYYEGDDNKPYKPNVSMCRVMTQLWGKNGDDYIGKTLFLYREPKIRFGKDQCGGIRISKMSHIESESMMVSITISRGKKELIKISRINTLNEEDLALYKSEIEKVSRKQDRDWETI